MEHFADALGASLGQALSSLGNGDKSRARVRDPDTFDGKDPEKLRTFLFQGVLNFRDRPAAFRLDSQKVNYMISYLTGDALGWFEPALVNPDPDNIPAWVDSYDHFVTELQLNFGTYDPRQDAENEIVALHMTEGQTIQKYLVRFNKLSQLTGWNSVALRKVFYDGLPERIQIKLRDLPGGKPTSLDLLKVSAQAIDASHWEWIKEQKLRRSRNPAAGKPDPPRTDANKSGPSGPGKTSSPPKDNAKGDNKEKKKSGGNGGNAGGSPGKSSPPADKPWAKFLGADGKLLESERKRRIDNDLCLLCGDSGHKANECDKRRARGRGAQTTPPPAASTSDSANKSGN